MIICLTLCQRIFWNMKSQLSFNFILDCFLTWGGYGYIQCILVRTKVTLAKFPYCIRHSFFYSTLAENDEEIAGVAICDLKGQRTQSTNKETKMLSHLCIIRNLKLFLLVLFCLFYVF